MNDQPVSRAEVEALVHATIRRIMPCEAAGEIPGHLHLKDLGADSVDRVEIILALRDDLGVDEPMSVFSAVPSVDVLVDVLHEARQRREVRA